MPLIASVSGIRGTVPDSLNSDVIQRFMASFCDLLAPGAVVVGRDGRPSGSIIEEQVVAQLTAAGRDVYTIGVVPTPTVQMEILRHSAAGGISISASHNPAEWNGLKFLGPSSMFLSPEEAAKLIARANAVQISRPPVGRRGTNTTVADAITNHIAKVIAIPWIDVAAIRARKFKVVVDAVNAGGSVAIPSLLREFG